MILEVQGLPFHTIFISHIIESSKDFLFAKFGSQFIKKQYGAINRFVSWFWTRAVSEKVVAVFRDVGDSDEFDTDLEDGANSSSSDESDSKPNTAPNELFMEVGRLHAS